jgi:YegS/Rv2252/BmrU family lipid kinase
MQKVLVIFNAKSGGGKASKVMIKLRSFLTSAGIQFEEYHTQRHSDIDGISDAFESFQPSLVITCGGDGTANDAVNALAPANVPFLILPAGSGNDFARMLYGRLKAVALFPKIKEQATRQVDLGICNGRYFLNGVGLGFDGAIARQTQQNKPGLLPVKMKYYLAIFKNILRFRSFNCQISRNGITTNVRAFMIAVANGTDYGGGFKIAPNATCDDGLLDMIHIGEMIPIKRPFYIPKVQKGKHLHLSFVQNERLKNVRISTIDDKMIPAHADGEIIAAREYDIKVVVSGLTVLK